jgi:hypothetical protein
MDTVKDTKHFEERLQRLREPSNRGNGKPKGKPPPPKQNEKKSVPPPTSCGGGMQVSQPNIVVNGKVSPNPMTISSTVPNTNP